MLNKLQFNNLVITNKKQIQQVKVQTIQKLVQKIRKLKVLLEKRPDDEKNRQRLRKTTESMEELKTLKRVDMMKRILLLDKTPAAVITNGLATPDEIAIATLATNKTMQGLVANFKTQLNLQAEDPSWKRELTRLSKRRFKMLRTEQKREKRKALKEQKAMARKRLEWLKGNKKVTSVADDDDGVEEMKASAEGRGANMSTSGAWHEEPLSPAELEMRTMKNEVEKSAVKEKKEKIKKLKEKTEKPKLLKNSVEVKKPKLPKDKAFNGGMTHNENKTETIIPSTFTKTEIVNHLTSTARSPSPEADERSANETTHVIDPFFITDSGENYRSTAIVQRERDDPPSTMQFPKQKQMNGIGSNKRPREVDNEKQLKRKDHRQSQKYDAKDQRRNSQQMTTDLHPSWAAKQKFKPVITNFQGKKIVFNDANEGKQNDKKYENIRKHEPKGQRSDNRNLSNLHPSWAAKQKFKPVIADFKGQKIVFDENDNDHSENIKALPKSSNKQELVAKAESDLHPSWVAKQKMKPTIAAFEGKKITFDDDV